MSEENTLEGEMPALAGATAWLKAQPLAAGGLRGKIVLIDFWTSPRLYWLRTLPYVRAWAEHYRDRQGSARRIAEACCCKSAEAVGSISSVNVILCNASIIPHTPDETSPRVA